VAWGLVWGWICSALVLGGLAWLGRGVILSHDFGFDRRVREAVHLHATPAVTWVMRAASRYGSPGYLTAIGAVAAIVLHRRQRYHAAQLVVVTILGALLLSACLKAALPRVRPDPWFGVPVPRSGSFPSGHALVAMAFFGGLAAVLARRTPRLGLRLALAAGAVVASLLVGLSRVYLGVHYPSDVVAGYGVALLWVGCVAATDRSLRRRAVRAGPRP
jgi:undecaprenyl-diphosphatase